MVARNRSSEEESRSDTATTQLLPSEQQHHDASAARIPTTSIERLAQAAVEPEVRTTSLAATPTEKQGGDAPASKTILYLAYGSNMCAETFLVRRKVRPVSQVCVSVPTLELSFDLAGIPYEEPCFANVRPRKLPEKPKLPVPSPPIPTPPVSSSDAAADDWDGSLMGVVYEVTPEDYANILRTEGGGSGYHEIVVPCVPLRHAAPVPELPRPIFARTLYKPYVSTGVPGGLHRPDPDYAQPSARYMGLLRDGASEHRLPAAYQAYLGRIAVYRRTTAMQAVGRVVLLATAGPVVLGLMALAQATADKRGMYRPAMAALLNFVFDMFWRGYDGILRPVFGDGERTIGE